MRRANWTGAAACLVSLVALSLVSAALGEITELAGDSYVNGLVPDTVTNDLSIGFSGPYSGAQLVIQLEAGSIYQHEGGGNLPPHELLVQRAPELAYDSFLAQGGAVMGATHADIGFRSGAVNLGGAASRQFDNEGAAMFWSPALGYDKFAGLNDQTDFLTARITLSSDARGSWSYLASADRVFGVVESMPIENGRMTVPLQGDYNCSGLVEQGDLDLVLLQWGATVLPPDWLCDVPDLEPGPGFHGIGQSELDGVLLNWGEDEDDSWSIVPDRVDPDETGGQITGLSGDFNGSGQVEQADWDLLYLNWGQPVEPLPDGWVNDLPWSHHIDGQELDRVFLNWGDVVTSTPASRSVPEPNWLAIFALSGFGLLVRTSHQLVGRQQANAHEAGTSVANWLKGRTPDCI